mgnify:CR=1 FL=1
MIQCTNHIIDLAIYQNNCFLLNILDKQGMTAQYSLYNFTSIGKQTNHILSIRRDNIIITFIEDSRTKVSIHFILNNNRVLSLIYFTMLCEQRYGDEECSICFDHFRNITSMCIFQCKHIFCGFCTNIYRHKTCPLCRQDLVKVATLFTVPCKTNQNYICLIL